MDIIIQPPTLVASSASIGIFDSGVGGLSVYQAVRRALPAEDLIYIADSVHAPYGDRSADFIMARAVALTEFLIQAGAKAIVVACNTATVIAVSRLRQLFSIPIIALEPAIKPAVAQTRTGTIAVLATRRTIESPAVARLCRAHGGHKRILLQPCPGFVEQVERNAIEHPDTEYLIRRHVEPLLADGADVLVLGCTHYVYLAEQIARIAGADVRLLDSSAAVARQVVQRLGIDDSTTLATRRGRDQFFTTDRSTLHASEVFSALLGYSVTVQPFVARAGAINSSPRSIPMIDSIG